MSVNAKMTAIADEVRELSGTTGAIGLDAMATKIGEANDEIGSQSDLLTEIAAALAGKAGGELVLQNKTVSPSVGTTLVLPDDGYNGLYQVIIKGDGNLVANNIREGISIFGISGIFNGDKNIETALIEKTLNAYSNSNVAVIGPKAFADCAYLSNISFPNATMIRNEAFSKCIHLTSVDFPNVSTIETHAFAGCSALTNANFPKAEYIGYEAFSNCSNLTYVNFPKAEYIGIRAFFSCRELKSVNFPKAKNIGDQAFFGCSSLISIYLTNTSICTLVDTNAFFNTGIGSNEGSIFVPASLVSSYKIAPNWAFFSNRIYSYS